MNPITPVMLAPTTVTVAPTETTLATLDVTGASLVSVQVDNLDGSQTFSGNVKRRLGSSMLYARSSIPDLDTILPGESAVVDLDVTATTDLKISGSMSGAGGNVKITARRKA